jgi:diacylglycerol kinase (ATP)
LTISTFTRTFLIYNPNAGKLRRSRRDLPQAVAAALFEHGHQLTVLPTERPKHATEMAKSIASNPDAEKTLLVVMGGDGTVNEVVNGLVGSAVRLAVLAGGTANVFCREVGIALDPTEAVERLNRLVPIRIGVGRVEFSSAARYFLLMVGAGFDASVVASVRPAIKHYSGRLAYYFAGVERLLRPLDLLASQPQIGPATSTFVLVSRVGNYGGDARVAPNIHLSDSGFEVVSFSCDWRAWYLPYLIAVFAGWAERFPGIHIQRQQTLLLNKVGSHSAHIQVDGELVGQIPAQVSFVKDALTILVPKEYAERERG